jgi:hypothetical protein
MKNNLNNLSFKSLLALTLLGVFLSISSKASAQSALGGTETKTASTADDNTPLNLKVSDFNIGKMYTRLLTFKYNPSQRDIFISSTVTTPFVTEEADTEQGQDPDKIREAKAKITEVISDGVKLSGIAYNRNGASYIVTKDGQIAKVGDYLLYTPSNKARAAINAAGSLAAEGGGSIKVDKFKYKSGLLLQVLKVDNKTAQLKVPWDDDTSIEIPYEKDMSIETKPQPPIKKDDF